MSNRLIKSATKREIGEIDWERMKGLIKCQAIRQVEMGERRRKVVQWIITKIDESKSEMGKRIRKDRLRYGSIERFSECEMSERRMKRRERRIKIAGKSHLGGSIRNEGLGIHNNSLRCKSFKFVIVIEYPNNDLVNK